MTTREELILKTLLACLGAMDNQPATRQVILDAIGGCVQPPVTHTEFEKIFRHADAEGYFVSAQNPVTKTFKWTLSDQGRIAFAQL